MVNAKSEPPRGILRTGADGEQRFRHARYHASPDLDPYVEHYWSVDWDLRGLPPERVETLPHPSLHLVFQAGGQSRITGVMHAKFSRRLEGRDGVFAVKFRPGGFYPFVRVPVSRYTDKPPPPADAF